MKHPGPWKFEPYQETIGGWPVPESIVDANGEEVVGSDEMLSFADQEAASITVSAPILLDRLKHHLATRRSTGQSGSDIDADELFVAQVEAGEFAK